jgi:hypothetical protein
MCLAGASGAGAELLAAMPDAELYAYFLWVPMLPGDNEQAALAASQRFAEPRATHYWDLERHLARRMGRALGIGPRESMTDGKIGLAWDVYVAYRRGTKNMEKPDFWMHQLEVKHAPRLDAGKWRRRVGQLVVTA